MKAVLVLLVAAVVVAIVAWRRRDAGEAVEPLPYTGIKAELQAIAELRAEGLISPEDAERRRQAILHPEDPPT